MYVRRVSHYFTQLKSGQNHQKHVAVQFVYKKWVWELMKSVRIYHRFLLAGRRAIEE